MNLDAMLQQLMRAGQTPLSTAAPAQPAGGVSTPNLGTVPNVQQQMAALMQGNLPQGRMTSPNVAPPAQYPWLTLSQQGTAAKPAAAPAKAPAINAANLPTPTVKPKQTPPMPTPPPVPAYDPSQYNIPDVGQNGQRSDVQSNFINPDETNQFLGAANQGLGSNYGNVPNFYDPTDYTPSSYGATYLPGTQGMDVSGVMPQTMNLSGAPAYEAASMMNGIHFSGSPSDPYYGTPFDDYYGGGGGANYGGYATDAMSGFAEGGSVPEQGEDARSRTHELAAAMGHQYGHDPTDDHLVTSLIHQALSDMAQQNRPQAHFQAGGEDPGMPSLEDLIGGGADGSSESPDQEAAPADDGAGADQGGLGGGQTEGLVDDDSPGQADEVSADHPTHDVKLSGGEYIIPADVVAALGEGNTDAGAKRLDGIVKELRQSATGTDEQMQPIPDDELGQMFSPQGAGQPGEEEPEESPEQEPEGEEEEPPEEEAPEEESQPAGMQAGGEVKSLADAVDKAGVPQPVTARLAVGPVSIPFGPGNDVALFDQDMLRYANIDKRLGHPGSVGEYLQGLGNAAWNNPADLFTTSPQDAHQKMNEMARAGLAARKQLRQQ
jgi:hypothetical protein